MNQPVVSVIIPSYNRSLLLKTRSIPSVQRQTYDNWEVIVVGDGPRNGAIREAVGSFDDPRIRYVEIPRPDYGSMTPDQFWHSAGAAARNHGLSLARGQFIAPLDDDDEFLPNHLEQCVATLGAGEADLVYGSVIVRDFETGTEYDDYFPWHEPGVPDLFLKRNIMFHSSVCYHRKFADLRYAEDGAMPADYALWLAIFHAGGRFRSLDAPQAVYSGDRESGSIRVSAPTLPPFEDVQKQFRRIYESRMLSNSGPMVRTLEERLAQRLRVPHVITAPSGDIALILALKGLRARCPQGRNELILPSYAHPSLINAALWNGYEPVFCDVDPDTLCITPATASRCAGPGTAAIAALHPHGFPADMESLHALARDLGVPLLADAAAAFGAELHGRPIGGFGDIETFSLSGTKSLTAGEGGLVCCRDDGLAQDIRRIARYGIDNDGQVAHPGINGKLAEFPAALALTALDEFDGWLARRRAMERLYRDLLSGLSAIRFIVPAHPSARTACKDMTLIMPTPEATERLALHLAGYRIVTRPYYRMLHKMPPYAAYRREPLAVSEQLSDCTICIPLYSDIREDVVQFVASAVREALE